MSLGAGSRKRSSLRAFGLRVRRGGAAASLLHKVCASPPSIERRLRRREHEVHAVKAGTRSAIAPVLEQEEVIAVFWSAAGHDSPYSRPLTFTQRPA